MKLTQKWKNLKLSSRNKQFKKRCIEIFLKRGLFKTTEFYLQELQKRNIKFRENLKAAINNISKKLDEIHNKFRFDENEFQT